MFWFHEQLAKEQGQRVKTREGRRMDTPGDRVPAAETRFHNAEALKLPKGNTSFLCLRKVKFDMSVKVD